eukprot:IDg18959t1
MCTRRAAAAARGSDSATNAVPLARGARLFPLGKAARSQVRRHADSSTPQLPEKSELIWGKQEMRTPEDNLALGMNGRIPNAASPDVASFGKKQNSQWRPYGPMACPPTTMTTNRKSTPEAVSSPAQKRREDTECRGSFSRQGTHLVPKRDAVQIATVLAWQGIAQPPTRFCTPSGMIEMS